MNFPARVPQPLERLGAGHLLHQVPVNIYKALAGFGFLNDVGIPNFIVKRLRHFVPSVPTCVLLDLSITSLVECLLLPVDLEIFHRILSTVLSQ